MAYFGRVVTTSQQPDYKPIKVLGSGVFGFVLEAEDKNTKQHVAIKRTVRVNRELGREYEILSTMGELENVVKIKDIFFTKTREGNLVQNIVFEYVEDNLESIIQRCAKEHQRPSESNIKSYMYQLLHGLKELHSLKIAHRDLKPENVLVSKNGRVKICDFGSSKVIDDYDISTPYVVSRVYRAPELLLCITSYSFSIDIWAAGCILAELFLLEPFFYGTSEGNQLFKILETLGSFSAHEQKQFQNRVSFHKSLFKEMGKYKPISFKQKFSMVKDRDNFLDLLLKMLAYLPEKRITAKQALDHPFFNGVNKYEVDVDADESTTKH